MTGGQQAEAAHLLADAEEIARAAGVLLREHFATEILVEHKGELDLVTEVDRAAQDLVEREIRRRHPGHGLLAEEGLDDAGDGGFLWIVDPLDGTTNYVHRFPVFAVSIGVYLAGEALAGVVYNPMAEELFAASAGGGSRLNGRRIRVSTTPALDRSLLATGFPYGIRHDEWNNLSHFSALSMLVQGIRRCGSASLDICFVACGRLDGFWELGLKSWDVAGGALIVREAGGKVTDFNGLPPGLDGSRFLATNGLLHEEMAAVLRRSRPGQG